MEPNSFLAWLIRSVMSCNVIEFRTKEDPKYLKLDAKDIKRSASRDSG
jgi:hypothetical protein